MFGPAINKHLPHILPLVKKKQELADPERIKTLRDTLVRNGGEEAEKIFDSHINYIIELK
jgi:hypothetical protein